jgi:DUF4097 and DUF4098 domain-containing protein YvlB
MFALALMLTVASPDTTLRLPRNGAVEVDSRTRDVVVRIGTGDQVTVVGAGAELDGNTVQIDGDDDGSRRRFRSRSGAVEITIPASARLEVSSISGALTFTGTPAHLHAESIEGAIRVLGGSGEVELEAVSGNVTVNDFRGTRLEINSTGGLVAVTNATGAITVDNVNREVTLRGIHGSSRVEASSINAGVLFEGDFLAGGNYEFSSQNGSITLIVPPAVSARMEVSTMSGRLDTQIPAVTNGANDNGSRGAKGDRHHRDSDEQSFTAVFGGGASRVSVDVFNGSVVVRPTGWKP